MDVSVPSELLYDYQGKCWWCGSSADSREHRYKKSDVVRNFQTDIWKTGVVRVKSGSSREEYIQGANSRKLKFAKVLCARCNNERSQVFDRSYDIFAQYLHSEEELIVSAGEVHMRAVFGTDWSERTAEVLKYFVKHACCRLAEDRVRIPDGVLDFLNDTRPDLPHMSMDMSINLSVRDMTAHMRDVHGIDGGSLWSGPHQVWLNSTKTAIKSVNSHFGINCYFLGYSCDMQSNSGGLALQGDRLAMPSYRPESLEDVDIRDVCQDCNP
ncbi:hypothetical protein [Streptomyces sp. NRRL WC-3549]|uniref:hypothetical protein n=1 Tax=Streptomyces sp. NRRL WC-3549 TaxID=1463925 RepID=UPI00131D77E0|nr:hypothetical protein [Streptomyces sp. NRRL WC-3549]